MRSSISRLGHMVPDARFIFNHGNGNYAMLHSAEFFVRVATGMQGREEDRADQTLRPHKAITMCYTVLHDLGRLRSRAGGAKSYD